MARWQLSTRFGVEACVTGACERRPQPRRVIWPVALSARSTERHRMQNCGDDDYLLSSLAAAIIHAMVR